MQKIPRTEESVHRDEFHGPQQALDFNLSWMSGTPTGERAPISYDRDRGREIYVFENASTWAVLVGDGDGIAAASHLGFKVKKDGASPNAAFNFSSRGLRELEKSSLTIGLEELQRLDGECVKVST